TPAERAGDSRGCDAAPPCSINDIGKQPPELALVLRGHVDEGHAVGEAAGRRVPPTDLTLHDPAGLAVEEVEADPHAVAGLEGGVEVHLRASQAEVDQLG